MNTMAALHSTHCHAIDVVILFSMGKGVCRYFVRQTGRCSAHTMRVMSFKYQKEITCPTVAALSS